MNISKIFLKIVILISIFSFSCKKENGYLKSSYTFKALYFSPKTFPIYPKAEPDFSFSKVGIYVISHIYGWDPKEKFIYSYYTEDNLENVKKFYEEIYLKNFECEIINHEEFVKRHWDLFQEQEFPDIEGYFEHCKGTRMDLLSPFYHYGESQWESGTMIIFHGEKYF